MVPRMDVKRITGALQFRRNGHLVRPVAVAAMTG
jgi:hypothetical protein